MHEIAEIRKFVDVFDALAFPIRNSAVRDRLATFALWQSLVVSYFLLHCVLSAVMRAL